MFFSTNYCISEPLFTHLWTLSIAFVLILGKTGFNTPIFNYILSFLYKGGIISMIYHKYGNRVLKTEYSGVLKTEIRRIKTTVAYFV